MTVHRVDVGDGALHVEESGAGPVVVLAHALLTDGRMFAEAATLLARDHRVVAVDARGHGRSDRPTRDWTLEDQADDLARVMDALGLERATVVGSSMGAMSAVRLALRAPSRVAALGLVGTDAQAPPLRNSLPRWLLAVGARAMGLRPSMARAAVRPMFGPTFRRARPDVVTAFEARVGAMAPAALARAVRAVNRRGSVLERLGEVSAPTLLIFGDEDDYTPAAAGRRMQERLRDARMVVVPRAGHLTVTERPDETVGALRELLARVEGRTG